MPYLFKLSRRVSRFRARTLLGAAALVVVNDQAAAQGGLRILATNPQGLAPTGVTLVFTVTASGYTEGVRGTLELAVAPDNSLVSGTVPAAPSRAAGTSPSGGYRFGD